MNYVKLTFAERTAAVRFCDTCADGEGYDVPKAMMKRLAELGLVVSKGFGRYEQTPLLLEMEDEMREVCELADKLNELSVAVHTCQIEGSLDVSKYTVKRLLARREDALKLLGPFGL